MKEFIKRKFASFPNFYKWLRSFYYLYLEVSFFFHAIITGKFLMRLNSKRSSNFTLKQGILQFSFEGGTFPTVDSFRSWLISNGLRFLEGRWTFYLPPQQNLHRHFGFLADNYPPDAGLKILKDFRFPTTAKYTNQRQQPRAGTCLKRYMTPSPLSLLQIANYLYLHGLGIKVYDIIALKGVSQTLSCYVVQHIEGIEVKIEDYHTFISNFKKVLSRGEITTVHESVDMMKDFNPPNCNNNLIMSTKYGKPLYIDFQGFLLNEKKIMDSVIREVKDIVHFGNVRFFRKGKKYLYQSLPGLAVGKRDTENRWQYFTKMLQESQLSLRDRVVYDVGCNMGIMLNNALAVGAQWGIGWDKPPVVECANKILLSVGATRFNLIDEEISPTTNFVSRIPDRYKKRKDGVLFFLAVSKHIGFPEGINNLPWEYMFYEGHASQDLENALESFKSVSWLNNTQILSQKYFADGDTGKRPVILLKR